MSAQAVTTIDIQGKLPKIASGKVRDLYAIDDDTLLFVASDRISAYDVIMENVSSNLTKTRRHLNRIQKPRSNKTPRASQEKAPS
jgi:phosphoribosylaminoimidazole-succinocarboxamide synthase